MVVGSVDQRKLGLNCLLAFVELFLMPFLLERLVPYFKPHRRDSEAVK